MEKLIDKHETTGVFSVKKVGKKKCSSKERILILTEDGISYYTTFDYKKEKELINFY